MKVSGFSFIHNGIDSGYPFIEATRALLPYIDEFLWIDASSTDGTREVLGRIDGRVRVIDADWGNCAGATLARLHAMNELCEGDVIVHCEADEVFCPLLASDVRRMIDKGFHNIAVHRIQIEQNGQRARWYPWPVHRVFPKGSVKKVGHTTDRESDALLLGPEYGLLWDVTNWFRDNWLSRIKQQSELRAGEPFNFLAVPHHVLEPTTPADIREFLAQPHWTWKTSPFALPESLKKLVGETKYHASI